MGIFFKLIRYKNLLIVILLQLVLYFYILLPVFDKYDIKSVFSVPMFLVFTMITALIAASGNIINDIMDVEIDKVNKPGKWYVGNIITVQEAYKYYFIVVAVGFMFSMWIAIALNRLNYMFLYIGAVVFLYLYSKYLKKTFLLGNVLVSLFTSGVIGIILIFEYDTGISLKEINSTPYIYIQQLFFGFMFFSFFTTFLRELVKDIEDYDGDYSANAKTIPLVIGIDKTKWLLIIISLIILSLLIVWIGMDVNEFRRLAVIYTIIGLIPFQIYIIYRVIVSKNKSDFNNLSRLIKVYMIFGIGMLGFYMF